MSLNTRRPPALGDVRDSFNRGRAFVLAASHDPARAQATREDLGVLGLAPSRKTTGACGVLRARAGGRLAALRLAKLPAGSSDVQLDVVPSLARTYSSCPRYLRLFDVTRPKDARPGAGLAGRRPAPDAEASPTCTDLSRAENLRPCVRVPRRFHFTRNRRLLDHATGPRTAVRGEAAQRHCLQPVDGGRGVARTPSGQSGRALGDFRSRPLGRR